jgi:serine/threonine protein kinase/WD40 repeat protein
VPDDPSNPATFPSQLESVLAEILQQEEEGRVIDVEGYCRSFPELAGPLRDYFCNREHFARLAPVLAPTPAQQRADPEGETGQPSSFPIGCRFGGYEILEELGRGGMGIVYKARQLEPSRPVALKIIRTDRLEPLPLEERRQWLERFRREAQMVAALDQPEQIVTLYEVGEEQGRPYFTMRLVPGGTLAEHLRLIGVLEETAAAEQRVRGQRDSARLLAAVARAVHYAHQHGILHRDLKPGNILLDENGRPLVSDFGLARRLDQTGSLVSAGIEGTAPYMSPEQAAPSPGAVTTAADVYSLGAILYECLTGQPPFKGHSDVETLLQVLHQEVTPPHQHNRRLDGDLETICLKCLQKEPEHRYPSAAALADDLDNWLAGRPINARPVGTTERLWRWCRRNPALAGSLSLAAVALLAFTLVAGGFAFYRGRAIRNLDEANRQLGEANRELDNTNHDLDNTNRDLDKAAGDLKTQRNEALSANEKLRREQRATRQMTAGLALDRARAAWQAGEASQGLLWMTQSLLLAPEDDAALQEAIRINLAGWRATLPPFLPPLRHPGIAANVRFSLDGSKIIVLSAGRIGLADKLPDGRKGWFQVARPETTADPFFDERWSFGYLSIDLPQQPPLRPLATPRGQVFLWDAASNTPLEVKPPPNSQVLAVSPDGAMALAAKRQGHFSTPGTVQVWNLAEGKPVGEPVDLPPIEWAFCSGDGKTFAGLVRDKLVLWDVATGKVVKDFPLRGRQAYRLEQSPDGNMLAILTTDPLTRTQINPESFLIPREGAHGALEVYDLIKRQQVTDLPAGPSQKIDLYAALAVGPEGRFVLLVSPSVGIPGSRMGAVRLWDRQKNKMLELPYQARLTLAQLSPDGKMLLTVSGRGLDHIEKVQLWDTETGQPRSRPLLPQGLVRHAAFNSNGKLLAISSGEGEVQLWDTGTGQPVARAMRHPNTIHALAFSPDGTKLVTGGHDGMARVWSLRSGLIVQPLRRLERVALVATDGSRYLQRNERNTLRLHDMLSGEPCGEPVPWSEKDHAVALGPDRRTLFVLNEGTTARLWNAETGKPLGGPLELYDPLTGVRFSRDGRTLLTFKHYRSQYGQWPMAYRWDTATGRSLGQEKNPNISMASELSPDGNWSLRILGDVAVIVDVKSTTVEGNRLPHPGPVTGGLFSPDSRTLLTIAASSGSWEEARLWDRASGKPLSPAMPHQGLIRARVFSPDGKVVLTGSGDGTAQLWDAATGKPLGPLMSHGDPIRAVAFSPDGKQVVTAGEDGMARLWHVATGRPLGPPLRHPAAISFVTFGPGGETLITAAGESVRVWKVPQALAGEAKHLMLRAEIEMAMELDGSTPRLLEEVERVRRKQQLEEVTKTRKN